ncbi:unnamed protein product [Brachionus calyciflorus]|uniref:RING-type domain-containing protein n=1 Tax=Brachionus calyciflorus TaxID=104777 RepID=A0A813YAW1_9BILA|nr:unnamed protein product [Brachionus calyciflorus]
MSIIDESPVISQSTTKFSKLVNSNDLNGLEKDENLNTININNLNKITNLDEDISKSQKSNLLQSNFFDNVNNSKSSTSNTNMTNKDTVFTLKKWNLVAMWSWDVECEVCAICRTPLMDSCLKCQTDNKHDDCVVVWGDCNHSFHNCCMSQWIKSRNLCPLCQTEWHVQRIGR